MHRLPPAFLLALVLQGLVIATRFTLLVADKTSWLISPGWSLTAQGVSFATLALLAVGSFELARRLPDSRARIAHAAGVVFAVGVALNITGVIVDYVQMDRAHGPIELIYTIESYLWSAVMIAGIATLVTAADGWRSAPGLAVVALGGILISRAPPVISSPMFEALSGVLGRTGASLVFSASWLIALGAVAALIARLHVAEPAEDGAACERGLRRASSALWLRVIAAAVFAGLSMLAMMARGAGGMSMLKLAMVAGPVINAFALLSFGFGAFTAARSGVRDVPSTTLYSAGALSLWAAGAMLVQLPWLYQMVYKGSGAFSAEHGRDLVTAFAVVIPLVAGAGIVATAAAIAGFARRRGLETLLQQATSRAAVFVVLILVSLLIQHYALPKARSEGTFLVLTLATAAAGLVAIATIANLLARAAEAVRQGPTLPTATVHTS